MDASTPTQQQAKKRGRPKGSKTKEDRDASAAKTTTSGGVVKIRGGDKKVAPVDDKYTQWKTLVPVLYDWFANHNLLWPSLSCRWGPVLEQANQKNRQRIYLSEQTDGSVPNTLVIANCEVVKKRVAAADHIANFNEESRSPFVKKYKTIIHPGEVNRIREFPQYNSIIATHTDCPEVLIWDIEAQPNRHAVFGAAESRPDLVLTGHEDNAEYALAMSPTEPYVLSGGKDKNVVLWSLQDHISAASGGSIIKAAENPSIAPRGIFKGHEDTVEDVQFCPSRCAMTSYDVIISNSAPACSEALKLPRFVLHIPATSTAFEDNKMMPSAQEFCSVGDDSCLILWDERTGSNPVIKVEKAHNADVHCVDWNPLDINLILTGSADHSVCMFDRRNLRSPVHKFEDHKAAVLCVQWCPDKSSVFGSSAEDGFLNIWDYERIGKKEIGSRSPNCPPGLFFKHAGHRDKVVDFHWNSSDPWTIVSVSDDVETSSGGGTLQIWRMSDLLYRPEEEVLTELEQFKTHVVECTSK